MNAAAWAGLLVASALAWQQTLAMPMAGMAMDAASGPMMGLLPYLAMWTIMMAAMMLPIVASVAIVWTQGILRTPGIVARTARLSSFVAGYLVA